MASVTKSKRSNQAGDVKIGGETFILFVFMFSQTFAEVVGDAEINRSVFSVAEEINVAIAHGSKLQEMDYKNKSCNDGLIRWF